MIVLILSHIRFSLLVPFLLLNGFLQAQSLLTGTVNDQSTGEPVVGAKVILTSPSDSSFRSGTFTNAGGRFSFDNLSPSEYLLTISLITYATLEKTVHLTSGTMDLGKVVLTSDAQLIDEIKVETNMIRVEQNGDTTAYNADAFKTNPDASVEDLVTKMPGITLENGVLKAHGEDVKKVLIDGEEFFGDDATTALKNLPAEIVAKIQVYDKLSDQAEFTGVSDGEDVKALNIVTKPGMNAGQFGKIYTGYGTDNRYLAGGSVNLFNGTQRISLIGMSNNVNQQNFSNEDILGVLGSDSQSSSGGRRSGRGSDNFLIGQQNGISQTHSFGINYSDKWGKKTKVSGSYFYNNSVNTSNSLTDRTYILSTNNGQRYNEDVAAESNNFNHRANLRIQYDLDPSNSIILTPRLSIQRNRSFSSTDALTMRADSSLLNTLLNDKTTGSSGYSFTNDLLYRHRFAKKGRSFSINLKGSYNDRTSATKQYSDNDYFLEGSDSSSLIDQFTDNLSNGYSFSSRLNYTEPVGENSSLHLNYSPAYTLSESDKKTNRYDSGVDEYRLIDTLLSSNFENSTLTQRAGFGYRYKKGKGNINFDVNYEYSHLLNTELFPEESAARVEFRTILPVVSFKYNFSKTRNMRIQYRSGTRNPSINQLQEVIDNSNPLSLKSGNNLLKQQYDHRMTFRFNSTNIEKASSFFVFAMGEYNSRYIANSTIIAGTDTLIGDGILLSQGSQYTKPVNLEGSWSFRSFLTYGVPVRWLKSNVNLNLGATYSINPGLINETINKSVATNVNSGVVVASNISEQIDFTVGYSLNYNFVTNTSQPASHNAYMIHNGSVRLNWIPYKRIVVNTTLAANAYTGLGSGFNQQIFLWNAGLGYQFLKEQQLELRVSVYDLLNQNTSIARNVTESYIEDVETQVLQRYFMGTLIYHLKNFKKGTM